MDVCLCSHGLGYYPNLRPQQVSAFDLQSKTGLKVKLHMMHMYKLY